MAITDNSFTAQEMAAAIQANPELANELKTFGSTAKFAIRSEAEETEFLRNYETNVISRKTSEFANNIERDVQEAFGEPKLENEKYHDYLKRAIGSSKDKAKTLKEELDAAKAGSSGSSADKARIKQLEDAITEEKSTWGTKITEKDKTIHSLKTGFEIEKALAPLRSKYKTGLPESIVKVFESNLIASLQSQMKEIDGVMVIIGEDGNPILDKQTFKPMTISQVLADKMADIIDTGIGAAGAGTGSAEELARQQAAGLIKDAAGKVTGVSSVPAEVKTRVQLTDHLLKLGLTIGSKEYNESFVKFGKDLPLR